MILTYHAKFRKTDKNIKDKARICEKQDRKPGLGSLASAACKPHGNLPFTIYKISWKSKPDRIIAIPLLKNLFLTLLFAKKLFKGKVNYSVANKINKLKSSELLNIKI